MRRIHRRIARQTMYRKMFKFAAVVAIVMIAIAALALIVTGVFLLPNASNRAITIYVGVCCVVGIFSFLASCGLCLMKLMLRIINEQAEERERARMISEGDHEADGPTRVQDEQAD